MKYTLAIIALLFCSIANGQSQTKRVLFLGNSYTEVNNLPQMVSNVANSVGDNLIFESNSPGGLTLKGHSTNPMSLDKIAMGNWDYVVLQEQSQYPSFPINQVETDVFPYARLLDSLINAENPCAETVFYMTWGRKNGDASNCAFWPPVCTYAGMDSLLNLRYRMMAESNNAILSPVGEVWKYLRLTYPMINLYQGDNSHPSVAGTYAAACTFYAALYRKDPTLITFNPGIPPTDATNIRNAAKLIVYDSLMKWHIGEYVPQATFAYTITSANQVTFKNTSSNATNFYWNFGDGDTSTSDNPTHIYLKTGEYKVSLKATKCGTFDTTFQTINITSTGINSTATRSNFTIYPNPATSTLTISANHSANLSYKILNITGQQIQSGTINHSQNTITVSALPTGIYFLQLSDSKETLSHQKFIKCAE